MSGPIENLKSFGTFPPARVEGTSKSTPPHARSPDDMRYPFAPSHTGVVAMHVRRDVMWCHREGQQRASNGAVL